MTEVPQIRPRRSFIFTPGLRPDMFPKALASGADMVCVELEDGIAPKDKAEARRNALALFEQPLAEDGVEKLVRINSIRERFGIEDLEKYDILLMNLESNRLNHGALYLGEGFVLHHKAFDVSRIEKVKPYIGQTLYVIRKNVS